MAQGNALRVEATSRGPICYARLTGIVDESFDPNALLSKVSGSKVILNLKAINRLTSFGVREWTSAMRELSKKAERVFFVECSPAVVSQINMVANFSGSAQVLSVQVPFHCEACGWDTDVTYFVRANEAVTLPAKACQKCNSPMSFDDDVESYFAFLAQVALQNAPLDPSVEGLVRHFAQEAPEAAAPAVPRSAEAEPTMLRNVQVVQPARPQPSAKPAPAEGTSGGLRDVLLDWSDRSRASAMARSGLIGIGIAAVIAMAVFLVISLFQGKGTGDSKGDDNAPYTELMAQGRFARASVQIARLEKQQSLAAPDVAQARESLVRMAVERYNERLDSERFPEAEAIAGELERESTLPAASRERFNHDIAVAREKKSSDLRQKTLEAYAAKAYERVIQTSKRASMVAPLNADVIFAVAESHRFLGDMESAAGYYGDFIDIVGGENPPDERLDDALLWRASHLAKAGKEREAEKLVRRLLSMENSDLKDPASLLLEVISSDPSRSRPREPR